MAVMWNSFVSLLINVTYALLAIGFAFGIFWAVDRYVLKQIDILAEVKKGNVAAAILAGFVLLSICLVLSFTMR